MLPYPVHRAGLFPRPLLQPSPSRPHPVRLQVHPGPQANPKPQPQANPKPQPQANPKPQPQAKRRKREWEDGEDAEEQAPQPNKRRLQATQKVEQGPKQPPEEAGDGWQAVTEALWAHHRAHCHSHDLLRRKMELRERLHNTLRAIFPQCGLYVVGSSLNGFGSDSSDADMCLMLTENEVDQRQHARMILSHASRYIARTGWCLDGRPQLIQAKVPILRFRDGPSGGVEVDLNVNNAVGLRNTHLLQCYARLDPRVGPLALAVKAWARARDINDARNGTLSSYSIALMIVQYLQYGCKPPVLPVLQKMQPNRFPSDGDVRMLRLGEDPPQWRSENNQSLGALFAGFVDFYANRFSFARSVVCVRLGEPVSRSQAQAHHVPGCGRTQWKYVCIEEPFDQTNTARSVYDWDQFQLIVHAFHDTLRDLESSHQPDCLMLPGLGSSPRGEWSPTFLRGQPVA